jgi:hypothetical protein
MNCEERDSEREGREKQINSVHWLFTVRMGITDDSDPIYNITHTKKWTFVVANSSKRKSYELCNN